MYTSEIGYVMVTKQNPPTEVNNTQAEVMGSAVDQSVCCNKM